MSTSRAPAVLSTIIVVAALAGLSILRPVTVEADGGGPGTAPAAEELTAPTSGDATNSLFTTATTCALCHTTAPRSAALRTADGADVSPVHTWRATMMANSFRDPYWRAKVEQELAAVPPEEAAALQALCLGCHGPMTTTSAKLLDLDLPSVADAAGDPLAADGVSCTLCHQIREDGLGEAESFTAGFAIQPGRTVYGPYPRPFTMPMLRHSGYRAVHSDHVSESAVCGTCHTVFTQASPDAPMFLEQASYLEWRNSVFSDEDGPTPTSKTCRDCHMADVGTMRIARNPGGRDFGRVRPREHVRSHAIVGANTFMLGVLADNSETLGTAASPDQFAAVEAAASATLREAASLDVSAPRRRGGTLEVDVKVTNLTGHKLPSSYPSRRAWLRLQVKSGERVVFDSGAYDTDGRIVGPDGAGAVPHADVISDAGDVVIYEALPVDGDGRPTFLLHAMERYGKDTRILPRGWSAAGPHAAQTRPIGADGDDDFTDGSDTVTYRVPLAGLARPVTVHAWLLYQTVPPDWIDPLRSLDTPYAKAFVAMYDAATKAPMVLAHASVAE